MTPLKTIKLVAPVTEPITLAEAKKQLRLTDLQTFDDDYITSLIPVARDRAENYCNRYFTEQTILIVFEGAMSGAVELPYPDLTAVNSVKYTDSDGAETVIDSADYIVDLEQQTIKPVSQWPIDTGSFKVEAVTSAPLEFEGAKQAMLMTLTDLYELRTESVIGASVAENPAVDMLLTQYRVNMGF